MPVTPELLIDTCQNAFGEHLLKNPELPNFIEEALQTRPHPDQPLSRDEASMLLQNAAGYIKHIYNENYANPERGGKAVWDIWLTRNRNAIENMRLAANDQLSHSEKIRPLQNALQPNL